jgi:glycosyltransferase involved in cell wall biosynthesis
MNIAMTAADLPSDSRCGASYQAHYLANELVRTGHRLTMFSLSPKPADALYEHQAVRRMPRATIWRWALDLRGIDYKGFHVLHCHGDDCFLGGTRRPWHVRTLHGASLLEAHRCEVLKYKLRIAALALGEYVSLSVADVCIANARNTLRYFPTVRTYIPCGVDLNVFRTGGKKAERPVVLFVGGIQGKKRGWLLLKTFHEQIRPRIPDAELWVVSGEKVEGKGVRFFGKVETEHLVRLYQSAWVFCMPSSYEGFGVPYVEAMACGTPVVATHNDGADEVLEHGRFGLLCHDFDLGQRIVELLSNDERRRHFIERGLQRAQVFSWARVAAQYVAAYRRKPIEAAA